MEKSKHHHSLPTKVSSKDDKGKGKLVSHSEVPIKKITSNSKKAQKGFIKSQIQNKQKQSFPKETNIKDKIKVFTITKKDKTTLVKCTYMVDHEITFPLSLKAHKDPSNFGFLNVLDFRR